MVVFRHTDVNKSPGGHVPVDAPCSSNPGRKHIVLQREFIPHVPILTNQYRFLRKIDSSIDKTAFQGARLCLQSKKRRVTPQHDSLIPAISGHPQKGYSYFGLFIEVNSNHGL